MTQCLFDTNPWPEPILNYCQLEPHKQVSMKCSSKHNNFHLRKRIRKCGLQNVDPFVQVKMFKNKKIKILTGLAQGYSNFIVEVDPTLGLRSCHKHGTSPRTFWYSTSISLVMRLISSGRPNFSNSWTPFQLEFTVWEPKGPKPRRNKKALKVKDHCHFFTKFNL